MSVRKGGEEGKEQSKGSFGTRGGAAIVAACQRFVVCRSLKLNDAMSCKQRERQGEGEVDRGENNFFSLVFLLLFHVRAGLPACGQAGCRQWQGREGRGDETEEGRKDCEGMNDALLAWVPLRRCVRSCRTRLSITDA